MNANPNLKALRLQNNYKQEYVADILGISQPEYSKMENGVRKLDAYTLKELCKLYDVTMEVLLQRHHSPFSFSPDNVLQANQSQTYVPQEVLSKLMDNYASLIDNYRQQQQAQEKIIEKLIAAK